MADALTLDQVLAELQAAVEQAGGARAFAKLHGISATYVNLVLLRQRPPTDRILAPLRLSRRVAITYHPADRPPARRQGAVSSR